MYRLKEELEEAREREQSRESELMDLRARVGCLEKSAVSTDAMQQLAQEMGAVVNGIEAKLEGVNTVSNT